MASSTVSSALRERAGTTIGRLPRKWLGPAAVALLLVIAAVAFASWKFGSGGLFRGAVAAGPDDAAPSPAGTENPATAAKSVVELTPAKLASSGIETAVATMQAVQATESVPGTLDYDANLRLELITPVDALVREVLVEPGQMVRRGDHLAILTSDEIGMARDEVRSCEAELALAKKQYAWHEQIDTNLSELLARIAEKPKMADLQSDFRERTLGEYREAILDLYSKLLLAESIAANTQPLAGTGVLSGRTIQERRSNLEIATSAMLTAKEKSLYDSSLQLNEAKSAVDHAQRMLGVSREALRALVGPYSDNVEVPDGGDLSELIIHAPLDSRVEQRMVVTSARVEANQPMFVLANTDKLWVTASVREKQWQALELVGDRPLEIRLPAIPDEAFTAKLQFIGSEVSSTSRSVPLVAEIDNSDHRLRPGMFVWVSLPMSARRDVLAVPPGAIMRHEGKSFVFVEEQPGRYRRVDVRVGLETPAEVEILAGLQSGQVVVTQGAFVLKSELLLEGEAE